MTTIDFEILKSYPLPTEPTTYGHPVTVLPDGKSAKCRFSEAILHVQGEKVEAVPGPFEMIATPTSSNINMAGYDLSTFRLRIAFANGGVYEYQKVEPLTWAGFKKAKSRGEFFAKFVKGRYPYEHLYDTDPDDRPISVTMEETKPPAREDDDPADLPPGWKESGVDTSDGELA